LVELCQLRGYLASIVFLIIFSDEEMCSVPMNMLIWIQTVKMDKVKLIYFCSHLRALLIHCFILHLLAKLERIQFTLCLCNLCKFNCFKNEENIDINENLSLLPTIL
jgi:hypothetical protein